MPNITTHRTNALVLTLQLIRRQSQLLQIHHMRNLVHRNSSQAIAHQIELARVPQLGQLLPNALAQRVHGQLERLELLAVHPLGTPFANVGARAVNGRVRAHAALAKMAAERSSH